MSQKIRAMVQIDVELDAEEWARIQSNYVEIWQAEIKAGDVPAEIGAADAWNHMLQIDGTGAYEIDWEATTNEEFIDE